MPKFIVLGSGMNSITGETVGPAISLTAEQITESSVPLQSKPTGSFEVFTSLSELKKTFAADTEIKTEFYGSAISGNFDFSRIHQETINDVYAVLTIENPEKVHTINSEYKLNDSVQKALQTFSAEDFLRAHGDTIIDSVTFGRKAMIIIQFHAESTDDQQMVKASLQGAVSSATLKESVERSIKNKLIGKRCTIHQYLSGIDYQAITIPEGEAGISIFLEKFEAIEQKAESVPLSWTYKPYAVVATRECKGKAAAIEKVASVAREFAEIIKHCQQVAREDLRALYAINDETPRMSWYLEEKETTRERLILKLRVLIAELDDLFKSIVRDNLNPFLLEIYTEKLQYLNEALKKIGLKFPSTITIPVAHISYNEIVSKKHKNGENDFNINPPDTATQLVFKLKTEPQQKHYAIVIAANSVKKTLKIAEKILPLEPNYPFSMISEGILMAKFSFYTKKARIYAEKANRALEFLKEIGPEGEAIVNITKAVKEADILAIVMEKTSYFVCQMLRILDSDENIQLSDLVRIFLPKLSIEDKNTTATSFPTHIDQEMCKDLYQFDLTTLTQAYQQIQRKTHYHINQISYIANQMQRECSPLLEKFKESLDNILKIKKLPGTVYSSATAIKTLLHKQPQPSTAQFEKLLISLYKEIPLAYYGDPDIQALQQTIEGLKSTAFKLVGQIKQIFADLNEYAVLPESLYNVMQLINTTTDNSMSAAWVEEIEGQIKAVLDNFQHEISGIIRLIENMKVERDIAIRKMKDAKLDFQFSGPVIHIYYAQEEALKQTLLVKKLMNNIKTALAEFLEQMGNINKPAQEIINFSQEIKNLYDMTNEALRKQYMIPYSIASSITEALYKGIRIYLTNSTPIIDNIELDRFPNPTLQMPPPEIRLKKHIYPALISRGFGLSTKKTRRVKNVIKDGSTKRIGQALSHVYAKPPRWSKYRKTTNERFNVGIFAQCKIEAPKAFLPSDEDIRSATDRLSASIGL